MLRPGIAALVLTATAAQAEWNQIADADAFSANVVDNSYIDEAGSWFRFNADGSLAGGAQGRELTGMWNFERGMACYSRALGGEALPSDCIVVLVDGDQLVTVRQQGTGKQTVYTRQ